MLFDSRALAAGDDGIWILYLRDGLLVVSSDLAGTLFLYEGRHQHVVTTGRLDRPRLEVGMDESVLQIACDESGSEGENLTTSTHPVFVHASVNLPMDRATRIMDELRAATKYQGSELKSSSVLAGKHRTALLDVLESENSKGDWANIFFAEKAYFVAGKMIDLLVEEEAYSRGVDLVSTGVARHLATDLYDLGPNAIGSANWDALLISFNNLIRAYKRAGSIQPSSREFIAELDRVRTIGNDVRVTQILNMIWASRHQAAQYESPSVSMLRDMEPMVPTLNAVAGTWRIRLGNVPFELIADQHWTLTEDIREYLLKIAPLDVSVGSVTFPGADLRGLSLVDSKTDARVQVADVLAGVGRITAAMADQNVFDDPLQLAIHQMIDFQGLWSPGSKLEEMAGAASLGYLKRYVQQTRSIQ